MLLYINMMYNRCIKQYAGFEFIHINLTIDDNLQSFPRQKAQSMGLNLSSYIRMLLSRDTEEFRFKIDAMYIRAEANGYEPFSMKALEKDIQNAKALKD